MGREHGSGPSRTLGCISVRGSQSGLSLVELLVVMVLIGLFGAMAVTRFTSLLEQSLASQADRLRRDLAHAQVLAVGRSERLKFSASGSSYRLDRCADVVCASPQTLLDPATGKAFVVDLQQGAVFSSAVSFFLDSYGRPVQAAGLITTAPAATLRLDLSGHNRIVTVAPLTGFARLQ